MAYSVVFRDHDKTLEEAEITAAMKILWAPYLGIVSQESHPQALSLDMEKQNGTV